MEMHVPQAGDQEFAGGIDDARARQGLNALPYGGDASVGDGDRDVRARRRAGCVDNRGVLEDDALGESGWKAP